MQLKTNPLSVIIPNLKTQSPDDRDGDNKTCFLFIVFYFFQCKLTWFVSLVLQFVLYSFFLSFLLLRGKFRQFVEWDPPIFSGIHTLVNPFPCSKYLVSNYISGSELCLRWPTSRCSLLFLLSRSSSCCGRLWLATDFPYSSHIQQVLWWYSSWSCLFGIIWHTTFVPSAPAFRICSSGIFGQCPFRWVLWSFWFWILSRILSRYIWIVQISWLILTIFVLFWIFTQVPSIFGRF